MSGPELTLKREEATFRVYRPIERRNARRPKAPRHLRETTSALIPAICDNDFYACVFHEEEIKCGEGHELVLMVALLCLALQQSYWLLNNSQQKSLQSALQIVQPVSYVRKSESPFSVS